MDEIAYSLWDWVCRSVSYRSDDGEYWELPEEVLAERAADCDGTALLLTSMLRQYYPADRVHAVVGSYRGYGHMWVELDGEILETTYSEAHTVPDPHHYRAYVKFNDQEVLELWPRSMSRLFQLAHDEPQKLALMTLSNEAPECPSLWPPLIIGLAMGGILGTGFAMILQKEYGHV